MNLKLAAAAFAIIISGTASAAEVDLLGSGATKEVCTELIPGFEKATGHKVIANWSGSADIRKRVEAGEVHDLIIVSDKDVARFIEQGKMAKGTRADLMKSGVGAAVKAGSRKPDISTTNALKQTLLAASSIGYSTGPSGEYMKTLFERLGIAEQVGPKLRQVRSGVRIGTLIESGEAEIGFQQVSELLHERGLEYLGPLPADVQQTTVFSAGIHSEAKQPAAAKALVEFFRTPGAARVIEHHGMEPG